jgi:hypothetical protein
LCKQLLCSVSAYNRPFKSYIDTGTVSCFAKGLI